MPNPFEDLTGNNSGRGPDEAIQQKMNPAKRESKKNRRSQAVGSVKHSEDPPFCCGGTHFRSSHPTSGLRLASARVSRSWFSER